MFLLIAALLLGALPFTSGDRDSAATDDTIRIYVLSNGFHSDIALPRLDGATMQKLSLSEADYPVNIDDVRYWAVGWGSKTAYTSLLAISDLSFGIATKALAFDEAVMYVTPFGQLSAGPRVYAFDLSQTEYDLLISALSEWFLSRTPQDVTQGFGDRFYAAKGRFSPWMTCNSWTGQRLRQIRINVGVWTPISQSLEFGLQRVASKS
ncbi:MAG: DUF2459 domain-containing protein [Pseudomonadota bacterium]